MSDLAVKERRFKVVTVDPKAIVRMLGMGVGEKVEVVETDIPDDALISEPHYQAHNDTWIFRVAHMSFDPVPVGQLVIACLNGPLWLHSPSEEE